MPTVLVDLFAQLPEPGTLALLVAAIALAGAVRGFSGFGAAMIFMPAASSVIDPAAAAAGFLLLDTLVTLPLLAGAVRRCDWSTVLPACIGAMIMVPLGAAILARADTLALRWSLSTIVLIALALLVFGYRYTRAPGRLASVAVGAFAGLLSGVSQVSAPPVVVFWAAGPKPPAVIRANLITFFAVVGVSVFAAFLYNGFYSRAVIALFLVLAPVYGLMIYAGARGFGTASPQAYRPVAYGIILFSAISSLPLLDPWLR
ncbi:sulfite exporter TauE/SafE family protein [Stappia stellulata]|uniref:sulfite exporter TauE/SafE family protein n=1 Tax=Stappia stellulata TaxID=71235 RepID=UPI000404FA18|nr:sulfite exporter TauE/SafE family protein [Stappia stellulata]